MKLVTRRKSRLEKNKQIEKVKFKECKCEDIECSRERWIQPVERENDQRMILDCQVAEVSKPLLAVKRIVEKGTG
eukprot:8414490-Karenia_brevis.AAC.1